MFERDYLMRQIWQLIDAINRALQLSKGDVPDPESQAELLEAAIGTATELDGSVLLSLSPESIASILRVSGTDPGVVEYVGRSLFLASQYLAQAGKIELATLRAEQALALADDYGFELDEELGAEASMLAFLDSKSAAIKE